MRANLDVKTNDSLLYLDVTSQISMTVDVGPKILVGFKQYVSVIALFSGGLANRLESRTYPVTTIVLSRSLFSLNLLTQRIIQFIGIFTPESVNLLFVINFRIDPSIVLTVFVFSKYRTKLIKPNLVVWSSLIYLLIGNQRQIELCSNQSNLFMSQSLT